MTAIDRPIRLATNDSNDIIALITRDRDSLAAQLADTSGKLTRANNEIGRREHQRDEALGIIEQVRGELDAARSALDEVTRERDVATKALDVAEARIARTSERLSQLSNAQLRQLDDETLAQVHAEHKAIAELSAENARLRQRLAEAEDWEKYATREATAALRLLIRAWDERDEARALLTEALKDGDEEHG